MIKALLIESEEKDKVSFIKTVKQYCKHIDIYATCSGLDEAKKIIKEGAPKVVFTNVYLPGGNAFELVDGPLNIPYIILVSSYVKPAIKAVRKDVFDYLLKPVSGDDIIAFENRLISVMKTEEDSDSLNLSKISVSDAGGTYLLNVDDLVYLEANNNYTNIYVSESAGIRNVCVSKTLGVFEEELPAEKFFRVHRSYIVNIDNVSSISSEGSTVIMNSGEIISLSRRKAGEFRKVCNQRFKNI